MRDLDGIKWLGAVALCVLCKVAQGESLTTVKSHDMPVPPTSTESMQLCAIELDASIESDTALLSALDDFFLSNPQAQKRLLGTLQMVDLDTSYYRIVDHTPYRLAVVNLVQIVEEMSVSGTHVHLVFAETGSEAARLIFATSKIHDKLQLPQPSGGINTNRLRDEAAMLLQRMSGQAQLVPGSLEYSIHYIEDHQGQLRWARVLELSSETTPGLVALVDADTGYPLNIVDHRCHETAPGGTTVSSKYVTGQVAGRGVLFDPPSTFGVLDTLLLTDLAINGPRAPVAYSDSVGQFQFQQPGPLQVSVSLNGRWASVRSVTGSSLAFGGLAVPGNSLDVFFNPAGNAETDVAQVNGYYHTTLVHDYVADVLEDGLPEINSVLPVYVNDTGYACTAYYANTTDPEVHFFVSGQGCTNTAFDTVIYHEYGHFVDDMAGGIVLGDTSAHGLSEGWGDTLACFVSGQPLLGEGMLGLGTYIRTCDNDYQYPTSGEDAVHLLGQAWSGLTWHLRENLIDTYGLTTGVQVAEDLVLTTILANASDIPSALIDLILIDDDNLDLTDGTPHLVEIIDAASRHGLDTIGATPVARLDAIGYVKQAAESAEILGTANGGAMGLQTVKYELFSGMGTNPSTWSSIGPAVSKTVIDDLLGNWQYGRLSEGDHTIRLAVHTDIPGLQFISNQRARISAFTPIQITDELANQHGPVVDASYVVWEDWRNGTADIYIYDLDAQREAAVTTAIGNQQNPDISGTVVVWEDGRNGNQDIYALDLTTGIESPLSMDVSAQREPAIDGTRVVYSDQRHGDYEIYLYDVATGQEQRITNDPAAQLSPGISGNYVVWADHRHGAPDIYLYDLNSQSELRITSDIENQDRPLIDGSQVVWADMRNGKDYDIYHYDIETGETRVLVSTPSDDVPSGLHAGRVVWNDNRSGNFDIYLCDISGSREEQITFDTGKQLAPSVSNNQVVWADFKNDPSIACISNCNVDIYSLQLVPQIDVDDYEADKAALPQ